MDMLFINLGEYKLCVLNIGIDVIINDSYIEVGLEMDQWS